MLYNEYYSQVCSVLEDVIGTQSNAIECAGKAAAECISRDGIIYVFGCGHSHIVGEDLFFRAGGLASVCAVLDADLMLHEGAEKSSCMERISGIARPIFDKHGITDNDVLIIASTSGINAVPVEMAQYAHEKGVLVIAITSSAYDDDKPHNESGKHLYECADIVIDNCVSHGDAAVQIAPELPKVGPISTISSCMIAQSIMICAEEILAKQGMKPPVYMSGNIAGGRERNRALIDKYRPRIKNL